MTTILLPVTDHSRWTKALAEVALEIETTPTEIVVLYVFTPDDIESTATHLDIDDNKPDPTALARHKSTISTAVESFDSEGIDTRVRGTVVEERTGDGILSVATNVDADRIYMYSRERSPAGKAVFGSPLQQVLFESEVPVVVTPAKAVQSNG
jgi:nucleotide-binding universal stress UspA family protein